MNRKTIKKKLFRGEKVIPAVLGLSLLPSLAHAHCPLCTAGAGILAVVAASIGVPVLVVSTLLGGAALSMGIWLGKVLKKKFIPYQRHVITWLVYFSTVIPLWPILKDYKTLYAPFLGFDKYANKIPVDLYAVGVIIGAIILLVTPYLSKKLSVVAGKQIIPFQGIVITLLLLIIVPLLINWIFLI